MKTILLVMALLMAFAVSAQPAPSPVGGYIEFNGLAAGGVEVTAKNVNTGEVLTVTDVSSLRSQLDGPAKGKFSFDLSQFKEGYSVRTRWAPAHTIEVRVCDVLPECVQSYELVDTSVKDLSFSVNSVDLVVPEPVVIIEKEVVVEKEIVEVIICEDGSEVESVDDCPEAGGVSYEIFAATLAILGILLPAIGVTWHKGYFGLAKYWWRKGHKLRALRMVFTVVKRAKEDYYKKK